MMENESFKSGAKKCTSKSDVEHIFGLGRDRP